MSSRTGSSSAPPAPNEDRAHRRYPLHPVAHQPVDRPRLTSSPARTWEIPTRPHGGGPFGGFLLHRGPRTPVLDPAHGAHLGGGLPPPGAHHGAPVLRGFLLDQSGQDPPSGVVHGPGEAGAGQAGDAQGLQGDRLVLTDKAEGELVVVVGAGLPHLAVQRRHTLASFLPVVRSFLLPGQGPLGAGQGPLLPSQPLRVGDFLLRAITGGDHGQVGQAHVHPGHPVTVG